MLSAEEKELLVLIACNTSERFIEKEGKIIGETHSLAIKTLSDALKQNTLNFGVTQRRSKRNGTKK